MTRDIKSIVKDNKTVKFVYYRKDCLYYTTEDGFVFPVPVEDVGDATFNAEEKAILLMRYIRKAIKAEEDGLKDSEAAPEPAPVQPNPSFEMPQYEPEATHPLLSMIDLGSKLPPGEVKE